MIPSQRVRIQWMAKFEELAVKEKLYPPGKVGWDTATFLFNQGLTVSQAIERLLLSRVAKKLEEGLE